MLAAEDGHVTRAFDSCKMATLRSESCANIDLPCIRDCHTHPEIPCAYVVQFIKVVFIPVIMQRRIPWSHRT